MYWDSITLLNCPHQERSPGLSKVFKIGAYNDLFKAIGVFCLCKKTVKVGGSRPLIAGGI
jgi:hypothetical protein